MSSTIEKRLLQGFVWPFARRLQLRLQHASQYIPALQQKALRRCLSQVEGSEIAKDLGIYSGMSVEDFRKQVPVLAYDQIERYVSKVADGDKNAMFHPSVKVNMLALTSGTTGMRKLVPVTNAQTENLRRSWFWWGVALYRDYPHLLKTPVLHFTSSWFHERSNAGLPIGDASGYVARIQPWYVRLFYQVPESVSDIANQRLKYYTYLRLLMGDRRIAFISTATPATLVSLADWAHEWRDDLLRDLRDGRFRHEKDVPLEVWRELRPLMQKVRRTRIRELEQAMNVSDEKFWPRVFWPNLSVLATWTGGTMAHFQDAVTKRYGVTAFRDIGYVASEGHMTVPLIPHTAAGVPNVEDYFYEFIDDNGAVKQLHELEIGCEYSAVITTASGLMRHRMHDIVLCSDKYQELPLLHFVRKEQHIADLTGEKLSAHHVVNALRLVQQRFDVEAHKGVLAPKGDGYCFFIEMDKALSDVRALEVFLDEALKEANFIYSEHREVEKLARPVVRQLRSATFEKLKERRLQRVHAPFEQYKHPCLLTNEEDISFLEQHVVAS